MRSNEPVVIGAGNPRLRRLRRLNSRTKARSRERAFVVDGPVLVAEALRSDLRVGEIYAGPGILEAENLLSLIDPGTEVFEVQESVLASVLDPVSPRPLAAVADAPQWRLEDLDTDRPVLVAVELRDPGNMGTVIRTAEAAKLAGVVVIGDSVDHRSPKAVRASAGSVLRLPVVSLDGLADGFEALKSQGWRVLTAVMSPDSSDYDATDLTGAALVVGNEPHGLSPAAIRLGDGKITIPLADSVESLNVAAAAAVLSFEAARQQRVANSGEDGQAHQQQPVDRP